MKLNTYLKSGLLVSLTAGFFASCNDNIDPVSNSENDSNLTTISVRVRTQDFATTRADGDADGNDGYTKFQPIISTATKVNKLIYAVYDGQGNLLTEYEYKNEDGSKDESLGDGQNVINDFTGNADIILTVDRSKTYQILCWAQAKDCDAYDTSDLQSVKVSYLKKDKNYLNNDESRDAFCGASIKFLGSSKNIDDIELRRPFAQINVGTTGADFKMSAKIPGGTYYTYSQITLSGVANEYNVMTGEAPKPKETIEVTYSWNKIPAYWNMAVPTTTEQKIKTEGEEFLLVDIEKEGKDSQNDYNPQYFVFKDKYPTMDGNGKYLTEEFKYMSMCYVLVPTTVTKDETTGEITTSGATLEAVTLNFSGSENGVANGFVNTSFTLTQVPAAKNYRTNILGGLYCTKKPSDPDDPDKEEPYEPGDDELIDDPTTLFSSVSVKAIIMDNYYGDKETQFVDKTVEQDTTPDSPNSGSSDSGNSGTSSGSGDQSGTGDTGSGTDQSGTIQGN